MQKEKKLITLNFVYCQLMHGKNIIHIDKLMCNVSNTFISVCFCNIYTYVKRIECKNWCKILYLVKLLNSYKPLYIQQHIFVEPDKHWITFSFGGRGWRRQFE